MDKRGNSQTDVRHSRSRESAPRTVKTSEVEYVDGQIVRQVFYHDDGKTPKLKIKKNGGITTTTKYYENGKISSVKVDNGKTTGVKNYDQNGNLLAQNMRYIEGSLPPSRHK